MKSMAALAIAKCLVLAVHAADAPAADAAASAPDQAASAAARNKYVVKAVYGGKPAGDARYKTVTDVETSRETYGFMATDKQPPRK